MDRAREHLAQAMGERARGLRLKWADVARRADGMSQQHLLRIRRGQVPLTTEAVESIERALEWAPGSVEAILAGHGPTPLTPPVVSAPRWQTYRVTAEEALILLEEAMEDYGPGGFWKAFDEILFGREDTQRSSHESPSDQKGQTA